ncbi:MAG: cell envelope integrity protein CreD [Bacteroidetes bacterium]|uniref:cell envelope integrity protein CreD n=1 Tax=Phnomibacter sp. TaxID=2836217 RepID=UPI002FDE248F|nr:cell envelope integrity protein CreD [Bacteroidota bacterium]
MQITAKASFGDRFLIKGIITGFLILVMLIPSVFVLNLVEERKERQQEVIAEVSSKWASAQTLSGPFLIVPYERTFIDADKKPAVVTEQLIVLPEQLMVNGTVQPQIKQRSIYKVALYKSSIKLDGHFDLKNIAAGENETILWSKASLCMGLTDSRGIEAQMQSTAAQMPLTFDAGIPENGLAERGVSVPVDLSKVLADSRLDFTIPLSVRGSESLQVLPLGKTSSMQLRSEWESPSYIGKFLPQHNPDMKGFDAKWQVLHFNRDFPQIWKNRSYKATEYAFGVSLIQPADNYAKTMRSVKYAILFIGLMFGFFFLLEIMLGYRVHPVQYVLVGIALIVFYTLLLSIGELLTFNIAYAMATFATVSLITLYAKQLFVKWSNALLIGGFLFGLYAFIYVLIQLEDTSLLAGSIGLFLLVALAMYFSRKINWYQQPAAVVAPEVEA